MTRHPAHLTEEQVAQRVRQQVEARSIRTAPSYGRDLLPGGDAPAPAHEGPEERELPAAQRLRGQAALRALAAGQAAAVEEVCADFDAMLRHNWRRLGISADESSAWGATRPCAC